MYNLEWQTIKGIIALFLIVGIGFLFYFSKKDEYYYLRLETINKYFDAIKKGGKHHIKYEDLDKEFFINKKNNIYIHYLETLQKDINIRDK